MSNTEAKIALRGFAFFFAWFGGGLVILYGYSGFLSTRPAIATIVNGFGGYFQFLDVFWWLISLPVLFWWYIIRPIAHTPHTGGFRH